MVTARLENVSDVYVLSPVQQGLLYHTVSDPGSGVYVNQITARIDHLDVEAFKRSWAELSQRHPALRTAFLWEGLDEPLQVVRERAQLEWKELDWSGLNSPEQQSELESLLANDRREGFALREAPLFRMFLARLGANAWQWVWSSHHLIVDGWSTQVLLQELREIYSRILNGGSADLDSPPAYGDFIGWLVNQDEAVAEEFWREHLSGFDTTFRLDVPGFPPDRADRGHASHSFILDEEATAAVRRASSHARVTTNTFVMGAWALVLAKWARSNDVVFGVTTSGRPPDLPGIERAVGLYINTLPVRLEVDQDATVETWLQTVQQEHLNLHEHQHVPLTSIQHWSDIEPGEPLFETIFVFENYPPAGDDGAADLQLDEMEFIEQSNYPLAVLVVPGDELEVRFIYDTSRLHHESVRRIGTQLEAALREMTAGPTRELSSLETTSADERDLLFEWGTGPMARASESCIHELIEEVAARNPDSTALAFGDTSMSYAELIEASNRLAGVLQGAGVGPEKPVGLYVPRSSEMIVGMLGILKAGGAYVPLDPAYPSAHLRELMTDDQIDIVVTNASHRDGVPDGTLVVDMDRLPDRSDAPQPTGVSSDNLAYVIHTSGSTGRPKGVMVTHRNLVSSTLAREAHYGEPVERFLLLSSFAFDSSVAGIFWTLSTGGTLVLPAPRLEQDLHRLLKLAEEQKVTHLLCLPALYELMLEDAAKGQLDTLKIAIVAGEACPSRVVDAHKGRLPRTELHNEYGPTEATVWCTVHRVGTETTDGPVPIGRPIAGSRVLVVDQHGNPAALGFTGELLVGGDGVARGYLNRPDLTRERFGDSDIGWSYRTGDLACFRPDGQLLFLGRADTQVKVRGHRIEVGAVESAIRDLDTITDVKVAASASPGRSGNRLVAYVVADDHTAVDVSALSKDLESILPDFMIPDSFVPMEELPRLPNGKVDERYLPDPRSVATEPAKDRPGPSTETEAKLASIWRDLLGLEKVGIHDDYFSLGGDSIVSIQMISRARQADIYFEPADIVAHPTIAGLAAVAERRQPSHDPVGTPVTGEVPIGPIQRWFLESGLAEPDHWNLSRLFRLDDDTDLRALEKALDACVAHHDVLRARFEHIDGEWRQIIDPPAEGTLQTVDLDVGQTPEEAVESMQRSLRLSEGPLFLPAVIRGVSDPPMLLLAAHHLVVDVVSWWVFLEDLQTAYRQARDRFEIELPSKTTSLGAWVDGLRASDRSAELGFWLAQMPEAASRTSEHYGTEGSTETLTATLPPEETRLLQTEANEPYNTRTHELLTAALALSLAEDRGERAVHLTLEGHGRQPSHGDASRTVGWLTALFPLKLEMPGSLDEAEVIKAVKEKLRAVPDGGVGYGALRYLHDTPELAGHPLPPVLFNHLGSEREAGPGLLSNPDGSVDSSSRAPGNRRLHLIEVVTRLVDQELIAEWRYSGDIHDRLAIEGMADAFITHLRRLVDHCARAGHGGFTPSDFPDTGFDQDELDQFLEDLE